MSDLRRVLVPREVVDAVQRLLADAVRYFAHFEPRLLAEFARTSGNPPRRRLVALRYVGIDVPDTGRLTLIATIGAGRPTYYRASYAARQADRRHTIGHGTHPTPRRLADRTGRGRNRTVREPTTGPPTVRGPATE